MSAHQDPGRRRIPRTSLAAGGAFVIAARFVPDALVPKPFRWCRPRRRRSRRLQPQPVSRHRARRHGDHRGAPLGDGHRHPHRAAAGAADELEADWNRVHDRAGASATRSTAIRIPTARCSIRDFYDALRSRRRDGAHDAGAGGGGAVERAGGRVQAQNHEVVHAAVGQQASATASWPPRRRNCRCRSQRTLKLKPKSAFRYIGKDAEIYDVEDIVTGKAQFGHGRALRRACSTPRSSTRRCWAARLQSLDDRRRWAVTGVKQTRARIDPFKPPHMFQALGGVAVLADSTWAALQGRKKLKVDWENGAHASFNSDAYQGSRLLANARRSPARSSRNVGDVDAGVREGRQDRSRPTYYTPLLAHAPMEPPAAVAEFKDGKVTVLGADAESAGRAGNGGRAPWASRRRT